jgi:hypothetical protein
MSLSLNPSLAVQNSLAMIAALSCVEFIREIPLYAAGDKPSGETMKIKLLLAVIIVFTVLMIMFIFAVPEAHAQPGSATVRS